MWLSSYVDQNQMVLDKMQIPGSTSWIQMVRARAKDLDLNQNAQWLDANEHWPLLWESLVWNIVLPYSNRGRSKIAFVEFLLALVFYKHHVIEFWQKVILWGQFSQEFSWGLPLKSGLFCWQACCCFFHSWEKSGCAGVDYTAWVWCFLSQPASPKPASTWPPWFSKRNLAMA